MSKIKKTFKYRPYPTKARAATLNGQLGPCCELYNAALQERRDAYRIARKPISFSSQSAQLPGIKQERPDVSEVYAQVLQNVLHRVDKSSAGFFRRVKRGQKAGFPRFRSRRRYDSLTYPQLGSSLEERHLKPSKVGRIKIKLHRAVEGRIKTLSILRDAGRWYACVTVEMEPSPLPVSREAIGIDVGGTRCLRDAFGRHKSRKPSPLSSGAKTTQNYSAESFAASARKFRATCGCPALQKAHGHIRNQRSNFQHGRARELVNKYGFIAVEDLNVKGLAMGMLAKSVHDVGWSAFISKLASKAEEAARMFVKVDPRGTSQRCPCGQPVPKLLSNRWHLCAACGLSGDRG